jgi:hypothetical protein
MAESAVGQHAPTDDHDEQRCHRGPRDPRDGTDPIDETPPHVTQPRSSRPLGLDMCPQLVLESRSRARGLEGIVQLPPQREKLAVFVLLAHTLSFATASFIAFSAR